jgi:hypothetical protein
MWSAPVDPVEVCECKEEIELRRDEEERRLLLR